MINVLSDAWDSKKDRKAEEKRPNLRTLIGALNKDPDTKGDGYWGALHVPDDSEGRIATVDRLVDLFGAALIASSQTGNSHYAEPGKPDNILSEGDLQAFTELAGGAMPNVHDVNHGKAMTNGEAGFIKALSSVEKSARIGKDLGAALRHLGMLVRKTRERIQLGSLRCEGKGGYLETIRPRIKSIEIITETTRLNSAKAELIAQYGKAGLERELSAVLALLEAGLARFFKDNVGYHNAVKKWLYEKLAAAELTAAGNIKSILADLAVDLAAPATGDALKASLEAAVKKLKTAPVAEGTETLQ